jgi:hypothetical protein
MVGYCGIVCSDCPIFIVTQMNDDAGRKLVAETLTKQYGAEFKPEEMNCDGCLGDSPRIYKYCSLCEIRKCAKEKNLENCSRCPEYQCEKLSSFLSKDTEDGKIWDEIRRELRRNNSKP